MTAGAPLPKAGRWSEPREQRAIFAAVDRLTAEGTTEDQQQDRVADRVRRDLHAA